nr:hypothetical protein [Candidatus Sigynarchaeota archaeon]
MANESNPESHIVDTIVFSELIDEGATPIAWYPPGDEIPVVDLTNISLKSISLLVGDKPDKAVVNDPRFIVDQKDSFAIIPFPDLDSVANVYMFGYTNQQMVNVVCTLTIMIKTKNRPFLFEKHDGIERLMKFTAFELLKLIMREKTYAKNDLEATLWVLQDKLDSLAHT